MLAIVRLGPAEPDIPPIERVISLGCAIQNILLSATAMGFGAGLASGKAMTSARLRALFALGEGDEPACFVNIGTVSQRKPPLIHPEPARFTSRLG